MKVVNNAKSAILVIAASLVSSVEPEGGTADKSIGTVETIESTSPRELTDIVDDSYIAQISSPFKGRAIVSLRQESGASEHQDESAKKPDTGILLPLDSLEHSRKLQGGTCPNGFVNCTQGLAYNSDGTATGNTCAVECNGQCCGSFNGNDCDGFTGLVCRDGSCYGNGACAVATIDKVIGSCKGTFACLFSSPTEVVDSCDADSACYALANQGSAGSIIRSCTSTKSCKRTGEGGSVGNIIDSCQSESSCYYLARVGFSGDITGSCNNVSACESLSIATPEQSDLHYCCNAPQECKNITSDQNLPTQCEVEPPPPGPDPDTITELEDTASALAFGTCNVDATPDDPVLQCEFASTDGAPTTAEILPGSCADNNDFNQVASSPTSTGATVTASFDFGSLITPQEKNAESFTKAFCARADVFANNNGTPVSIGVQKANIIVTMSYSNTGQFTVSGINITPVTIVDTTADATRSASISAVLGPCGGTSQESYNVGERVEICLSSDDTNAQISAIKSVSVENPSTVLVDSNGVANALTVVGSMPANAVTLGTLIIADYDDSGVGSITIGGTADITFVNRRILNSERLPQDISSASETFSLEIPLTQKESPNFVESTENSATTMTSYLFPIIALATRGMMEIF